MFQYDIFFMGAPSSGFDYFPIEFASDCPSGGDISNNAPLVFKEYLFGQKKGKAFYACRIPNMRTLVDGGRPNSSFTIVLMIEGCQFASWINEKHKDFFDKILYEGVVKNAEVLANIGGDEFTFGFTKPGRLASFSHELNEIRIGAKELFKDTFDDPKEFEKLSQKKTKNFSIVEQEFRPVVEESKPPSDKNQVSQPSKSGKNKATPTRPSSEQEFLTEQSLEQLLLPMDKRIRTLEKISILLTGLVLFLTAFLGADYLGYFEPSKTKVETTDQEPGRDQVLKPDLTSVDDEAELPAVNLDPSTVYRSDENPSTYFTGFGDKLKADDFSFEKWPGSGEKATDLNNTTSFFIEGLMKILKIEDYSLGATCNALIADNPGDVKTRVSEFLNAQEKTNLEVWRHVIESLPHGKKIVINIKQ